MTRGPRAKPGPARSATLPRLGPRGPLTPAAAGRAGPRRFRFPLFLPRPLPLPFPPAPARPPSPGVRSPQGPALLPQGPGRSPRGPKGGEFLWVPGVPRVRSKTGNCKSPQPSPCPSRNSRPSALTPQLIHSPGAGRVPQAAAPASAPGVRTLCLAPPRSPPPAG